MALNSEMLIQAGGEGGGPKIFENGSITETSKSQNGSITETKICQKKPFSRNFRGAIGAATDCEL